MRQQNTLAVKLAIKLKQYEVAITPQKRNKVVEISQVLDLERLEEIQEVIKKCLVLNPKERPSVYEILQS